MKSSQQQFLSKYKYNKSTPLLSGSSSNYTSYHGTSIDTNLPITIKILKHPQIQLITYLKKLKQIRSQNVIKIYELFIEQNILIMITEQVTYDTLQKGLERCKYLQETDAIFVVKMLLNGYVDMLRGDVNWFGNQNDIQITENGIKLSWNNGISYNLVNPLPMIIAKISNMNKVQSSTSILPFPKSKQLQQLLKLSKQNASQISMNPIIKKKQKVSKKKYHNFLTLKQSKHKSQYFDQFTYFSIHKQYGFIKVKIYQNGKISPNLLQLNKTKSSFVRIYETIQQSNKIIIVSEYSNEGNLQSYVTRLKNAGIKLKQDQIQFFVYSLLEPIKTVQESTLKSINMLNIRNIYLQDGIPKIGQPIPINQKINQVLKDRADVPDFYHPQFKKDPLSRDSKYDTYSLGVLLYKLMYTQYPIFPNGKVHIPTTPNYNKQLKQSVEIFLNEGGAIREIQQKIYVSEEVKKQVEQNKEKLKLIASNNKGKGDKDKNDGDNSQKQQQEEVKQQSSESSSEYENNENNNNQEQNEQDQQQSCISLISNKLALQQPTKLPQQLRHHFIDQLQLSSFKSMRIYTKTLLIITFYIFIFYFKYIQNFSYLLISRSLLTQITVPINNQNYTIITTDRYQFQRSYNSTQKSLQSLNSMNCLIQSKHNPKLYTGFIYDQSYQWLAYILIGLVGVLGVGVVKIVQVGIFDDVNAWYRKNEGKGKFNVFNYVIVNLMWLALIQGHYFVYNYIFNMKIQPCIGHKNGLIWGSTHALFTDLNTFLTPYCIVLLLQFLCIISYLIMIAKNQQMSRKYNIIINPPIIFSCILIIFWLMFRFGIIFSQYYYPTAFKDNQGVILNMWQKRQNFGMVLAIVPEVMFLGEIIISIGVNFLYYSVVDKSQRLVNSHQNNANAQNKLLDASLSAII